MDHFEERGKQVLTSMELMWGPWKNFYGSVWREGQAGPDLHGTHVVSMDAFPWIILRRGASRSSHPWNSCGVHGRTSMDQFGERVNQFLSSMELMWCPWMHFHGSF